MLEGVLLFYEKYNSMDDSLGVNSLMIPTENSSKYDEINLEKVFNFIF